MADRIVEEVAIYRKLQEMDDAEQDFLRQKRAYQKREDSLSERRHVLDDLINSEYQKMSVFLKRLDLSANADRKSTRLNSSHANISYAVFCLKKNKART